GSHRASSAECPGRARAEAGRPAARPRPLSPRSTSAPAGLAAAHRALLARTPRTVRRPRTGSLPTRSPPEPRPPADAEPALHGAVRLAALQRSPDEDDEHDGQGYREDQDHDEDR